MTDNTLSGGERLKKSNDIRLVFDKGVPFKGRLVSVYIRQGTGTHANRAAFIIRKILYKKKIVLRNRFRRVLREAYRNSKSLSRLSSGHDVVILANRLDKKTKSQEIEKEIKNAIKRYIKKYN